VGVLTNLANAPASTAIDPGDTIKLTREVLVLRHRFGGWPTPNRRTAPAIDEPTGRLRRSAGP